MSARILPAEPPYGSTVQGWLERVMPPGRPPLLLFRVLARDQRLFERFFSGGLLDRGHLTLRQREIVIDRTTAQCRSEYEWGVHVALFAGRTGLTDAQLASLVHGDADDDCWDDDDALLIRFCDQLHHDASVDDALWAALRALFCEEAILELLLLAGYYRTVSYLANALRLPAEAYAARFPPRESAVAPGVVAQT